MLSVPEFSKKIKEQYPQYKDVDDFELASKIVQQYPVYASKVDLKKKEPAAVTPPPVKLPAESAPQSATSPSTSIAPSPSESKLPSPTEVKTEPVPAVPVPAVQAPPKPTPQDPITEEVTTWFNKPGGGASIYDAKTPKDQAIKYYTTLRTEDPAKYYSLTNFRDAFAGLFNAQKKYYYENPDEARADYQSTYTEEMGGKADYDFARAMDIVKTGKRDGVALTQEQIAEAQKDLDNRIQQLAIRNHNKLFLNYFPTEADQGDAREQKRSYSGLNQALGAFRTQVDRFVPQDQRKEVYKTIYKSVRPLFTRSLQETVFNERGIDKLKQQIPGYNDLNDYQIMYLETLRNTDPEVFENRLKQLTVPRNLVAEKAQSGFGRPGRSDYDFKRGWETLNKEAEDEGLKMEEDYVSGEMARLQSISKKNNGLTEDQMKVYQGYQQRLQNIDNTRMTQYDRYFHAVNAEMLDRIGKATGVGTQNRVYRGMTAIGGMMSDAYNFVADLMWSSDDPTISDITKMGAQDNYESLVNRKAEELTEGGVSYAVDPEYKKLLDEVGQRYGGWTGRSVVSAEDAAKLRNAWIEYKKKYGDDPIAVVKNQNAGDINLSANSVLNAVEDVASQILGTIILSGATGGTASASKVKQLGNLFGTTFATTVNDYEAQALREGKSNATQIAIRNATIDAATELIGNDLARVKKLFGGKGTAGKILDGISDAEWKRIANAPKRGIFTKFKDAGSQVFTKAVAPAGTETFEELSAEGLKNLFDGKEFTHDMKNVGVTTFIGTLATFGAGLPFSYKNVNYGTRSAMYEAGTNPDWYRESVNKQLRDGSITTKEAQQRIDVIDRMAKIVGSISPVNKDGKPLSDKQRVNMAYNQYVKEIASSQKNVAGKNQRLNEVVEELDADNDRILNGEAVEETPAGGLSVGDKTTKDGIEYTITEVSPTKLKLSYKGKSGSGEMTVGRGSDIEQSFISAKPEKVGEAEVVPAGQAAELGAEAPGGVVEPTTAKAEMPIVEQPEQQKESIAKAVKEAGYDVTPEQLDRIYDGVIKGGGKIDANAVRRILNSGYIGANTAAEYINELGIKPGEVKPEVPAGEVKQKVPQPTESPAEGVVKINDVIGRRGTYKGKKGRFYVDGQLVVFDVDGSNLEYEVGNVEKIGETAVEDLGIEAEGKVVGTSETGNITVRGKEFINNYSDPTQAITRDEDGNVVSVTLESPDGKKRTFRKDVAQDIAAEIEKNKPVKPVREEVPAGVAEGAPPVQPPTGEVAPVTAPPVEVPPAPQPKTIEDQVAEEQIETERLIGGQAAKNRKAGRYVKDNVEYVRNETGQGTYSDKKGEVRFTEEPGAKGVVVPFRYKLVEAETLQPSHINGLRNPNFFIPEAQPKSRLDKASIQAEEGFADNPRFKELGENTNAYSGAPVVNQRNEVIQGNNRTAGLKKGYQRGNNKYREDLRANATQFGFSPSQVDQMKNPVLVREVAVSDDGAIELGNYDAKDLETGSKRGLDPIAITRRLPFETKQRLAELFFNDEMTVNEAIKENIKRIMENLGKYLNQAQRNTMINNEGKLTENGTRDLESVAKQLLFDEGDVTLPEQYEYLTYTQRKGIETSLPYIFGAGEKNIKTNVQNAIAALNGYRSSGAANFGQWLSQTDAFSQDTPKDRYSPLDLKIAEMLATAKTQKEIKEKFQQFEDAVKAKEATMFEPAQEGASKEEAIKKIFEVEAKAEDKKLEPKAKPKVEEPAKEKKPVEAQPKEEAPQPKKLGDDELQKIVGVDIFKAIQKAESELGEGVVDRNRMIEAAKKIQQTDGKEKLLPEHIFEALQYEFGYPDNWQDLRNAIKKGGVGVNADAIERMIEIGVELPEDIVEDFNDWSESEGGGSGGRLGNFAKREGKPKVYNVSDLKKNPEILKEDPAYQTIGYDDSFSGMYADKEGIKNQNPEIDIEKLSVGDEVNFMGKAYAVQSIGKVKKSDVQLIRIDNNGNLLREANKGNQKKVKMSTREFVKKREEGQKIYEEDNKKQKERIRGEEGLTYKDGDNITFKLKDPERPNAIIKLNGEKVTVPGYEGLDFVVVKSGLNYDIHELATGMKLSKASSFSKEEAISQAVNDLSSGNITQEKLLNRIYSKERDPQGKLKLNPSPAFEEYRRKKEAEFENLPFLHTEQERKKLLEYAEKAKNKGIKNAESMILSAVNQRVDPRSGLSAKLTEARAQEIIDDFEEKKVKKESEEKQEPYPQKYITKLDKTLGEAVNEDYRRDQYKKLPKGIAEKAEAAYKKLLAIRNKYGYYPDYIIETTSSDIPLSTIGYLRAKSAKKIETREERAIEAEETLNDGINFINQKYYEEFGGEKPGKVETISEGVRAEVEGKKEGEVPTEARAGDPIRKFSEIVRSGKISKLGGFKTGTGFDAVWDASLEVIAKALDGGASLADAIEAGLKYVKKTGWYKKLTNKEDFDNKYREHLNQEYNAVQERSAEEVLQPEPKKTGKSRGGRRRMEQSKQRIEAAEKKNEAKGKEEKITKLSLAGIQDVGSQFGLEVPMSQPKTDEQLKEDAENKISEWEQKGQYQENIEKLLGMIGTQQGVLTDTQRMILENHLSNQKEALMKLDPTSAEFDSKLKEIKRLLNLASIARSEAGRALRLPSTGVVHPIADLPTALVTKMDALGVDELTDIQKEEVFEQVENYKEAETKAEEKIRVMEEKAAEMELKDMAAEEKKKPKKTKEQRQEDRKKALQAAREALRDLRTGKSGLSAVPLPGIRELIAIAPHVKTVVSSYLGEGIDNLSTVIDRVHEEFSDVLPGISKRNIRQIIAGEFNPKSTESDLRKKARQLQTEAKLLEEYERLLLGEPTTEKQKRQKNLKTKEIRDKIKALRNEKELGETYGENKIPDELKKIRAITSRNKKMVEEIDQKIANKDFAKKDKTTIIGNPDLRRRFPKEYNEMLDAIKAREDAKAEFDIAVVKDEMARESGWKKFVRGGSRVIATLKALRSGIDDSAVLVQNYVAIMAHPSAGIKAFITHLDHAFSQKRFDRYLTELHENRPVWELITQSGLDITEPMSLVQEKREEAFANNLLDKTFKIGGRSFNIGKWTTRPFERMYTSMGNAMRLNVFLNVSKKWHDQGITFEADPARYQALAQMLNTETGRGKLHKNIQAASELVTPIIWSPRLMQSKFNILGLSDLAGAAGMGKGYYSKLYQQSPEVAKYAAQDAAKFLGTAAGLILLTVLTGAGDADIDPESSGFGTITIGNKRISVFDGFNKYVRVLSQIILGTTKVPVGYAEGEKMDKERVEAGRLKAVGRFFRSSMTPAGGLVTNLMLGEDYMGKPLTFWGEARNMVEPMSISGLREEVKKDGALGSVTAFFKFFGAQINDNRDFETRAKMEIKDPETLKKRPVSRAEYEQFVKVKDEFYSEYLEDLKAGQAIIYLDQEGKIRVFKDLESTDRINPDELDMWQELYYEKLTDEQREDVLKKVESWSKDAAKKELFED